MLCGLPPSCNQETFQTMFKIVETIAMNKATLERYLRHAESAPSILDRFCIAKKRRAHGMRDRTPVGMYIPAGC